jgi:hypothetical protein
METMLTLALLAGVTALAWPALEKPFALQRLKKAGDQIHAELTRARGVAIRSGRTQELLIDATTGRYAVLPTVDYTDADQMPSDNGNGLTTAGTALPEGIRLAEISAIDDVTPAPQPVGFVQSGGDEAQPASQTIYFHPDGTTSTAVLVLADEYGMALQVQLRGLTGAVAKGEPLVYEVTP